MVLQKTSKTVLSSQDILDYIQSYESNVVPELDKLWEYYKGKDVKILQRKTPDPNNPDNKIVVSYARKIVNTFTGYGYRPKYITYKPNIKKTPQEIEQEEIDGMNNVPETDPIEKVYVNELQNIYNTNNEHIKTNRAGRNTGIYGLSYELLYVDTAVDIANNSNKVIPRFFTVDPREMILLYDYSPEPKKSIAIRYFKVEGDNKYKVEVYYKDHVDTYYRQKENDNSTKWILVNDVLGIINPFKDIPVIPYYIGDEIQSIFANVLTLIDAYDVLFSDSLNEFDRFAFAYLIMKRISLTTPSDAKDPEKSKRAIQELKRRRVFEGLDKDADVKFLTKDIPTAFIQHIGEQLKNQIHTQSHVPDFSLLAGAMSGAAIDRLLFDFENLVSSAEADFDVGLCMRGNLITDFLKGLSRLDASCDFNTMVSINHKRNIPLNKSEYATLALTMSQGGFSRKCILENMPEDMVQDVEQELKQEKMEQEEMLGSGLDQSMDNGPSQEEQAQIDELVSQGMSEEEAINQIMGGV